MNTLQRTMVLVMVVLCAHAVHAQDIPGTDLYYQGPGTVSVITDDVANVLADAPYGGVQNADPATVIIQIAGAGSSANLIMPKNKTSQQLFALFVEGDPSVLHVSGGQSGGAGVLPYLYVNGTPKKILFSGMQTVGKVVVDNAGDQRGVHVQNISKGKGKTPPAGGGIHSVITAGLLKRIQSNHGSIGGTAELPGVIAVGVDSPKGQIKCSSKGDVAHVLICKALLQSNQYDYAAAYAECLASNAVLPYVALTGLQAVNTKAIGPAVIGADVLKKYKPNQVGTRLKVTEPLVGKEHLLQ